MKSYALSAVMAAAMAASLLFSGCNSSSSSSSTTTPPPQTSPAYVYLQAPQVSLNTQLALAGNLKAQRRLIAELRKKVQRILLTAKVDRALLKAGIAPAATPISSSGIDLYFVAAGSSSPVKLNTNSTIIFTGVALSPDGTEVAYTALDASQTSQLYLASVTNFSQATQLTSGSTYDYAYPVFSPDGKTIATTVATVTHTSGTLGLATIPVAGGQPTILTLGSSVGFAGAAVFTADSAHLIFSASPTTALDQPAYIAIYECNLDGSGVKQLSNPSDAADYDLLPSVSADGSTIVFTRLVQSSSALKVSANIVSIPLAGETASTAATPLTTDNMSIWGAFVGSASNSRILYTDVNVTTTGSTPTFVAATLYEMNNDGSNRQEVASLTGGAVFP
jgi:Tol biopolymer transport system component